jgi:ABC-2 type transport system ATP-binding protein
MIEVSQLTFEYPGYRALHGVNVSLVKGSVTALVGPNGAGKTTLMRCIAGLETPLSGTVTVAGIDVHESPREVHRLMGYLSDHFGLYADLTVAQGLEYAARAQGLAHTRVRKAVEQTADQMGLADKLGHKGGQLSRGQRQRLAIGQAIIHTPDVLLLDEPASGLDPEARSALAGVFRALQADGMTLLVSSHILAELDEYSTHMLALNAGQVLEHRALSAAVNASAAGKVAPRHLRLEFVQNGAAAAQWLRSQLGVEVTQVQDHVVDVQFAGSMAEQAQLLAACVHSEHAVCALHAVAENLQTSYLKSLQAQRSAAAEKAAR